MPGSLRALDAWRLRRWTLAAMVLLLRARWRIAFVPFARWSGRLGWTIPATGGAPDTLVQAGRLARHVERAAARLPIEMRCLPQAMALSALLRRARIGHSVVFAVRPASADIGLDRLHAWVECEGVRVIGDLPGRWIELHRLGTP